jgi:hypothetical protein
MLVEFTVTNFRSIRSTQTFSLVKGKGDELAAENTFSPDAPGTPELLRSAAIYGPNAAGKSNLIDALRAMGQVVVESAAKLQPGDALPVTPFRLDAESESRPTEFEVSFVASGVRYQYGFSATRERVLEEWLLAYPKGRPQRWFERVWDAGAQKYEWEMGPELKGQKQLWQDATRANALFLSTAAQLNSDQLSPVYDWFKRTLRTAQVGGWSSAFSASLCEEADSRVRVVEFLRAADLGIDDVQVVKEKFDARDLPDDMPEIIKQQIAEKLEGKDVLEIKTLHRTPDGRTVVFELDDESDGTQKLFAFAGPWLDSLRNGYVLFIDELHDNLHPKLVSFLVELFHSPETNPNNAQLVFTTHETSILSQEVFRRDQIWFCEKDDSLATQLVPLTDFSPRKGRENLELSYLAGRYGALPYVRKLKTV